MMITSLLLPPSALLLEAAAAKSLCKGPDAPAARTSARVRFAAGEATTSVAARVTAAAAAAPPFASCSVAWAKNDLMDGTAAAAAADDTVARLRRKLEQFHNWISAVVRDASASVCQRVGCSRRLSTCKRAVLLLCRARAIA